MLIQHDGFVAVYSHLAMAAPTLGKAMIMAGEEVGIVGHTGAGIDGRAMLGSRRHPARDEFTRA